MNKFLNLFIKGIFVGIANIIPGVSGGTIAVVLRIFDQMIDAINNFFKEPKKHIKFLFPLMIGAGVGILLFSKILEFALANHSLPTNMFFVGLVIGSIPLIYNQAKTKEIKPIYYLASLITFSLIVFMSFVKEPTSEATEITLNLTWGIRIFFSSMIASAAMVIPGISGSFVMVLLGLYNIILLSISGTIDTVITGFKMMFDTGFIEGITHIVTSNNFLILVIAGIGILLGVVIISKIIAFLLEKAFSPTYFAILGLIFGSIFSIFKDPMTYSSYAGDIPILAIIISIITLALGFIISFKIGNEE